MTDSRGLLFIVSSPSGGGKTTLIKEAMKRLAAFDIQSHFSISHTTRPARPAENDGVDYHFVSREEFESMEVKAQFLEWAEYAGNLYGTSREEVENRLSRGIDVFLDIEVQGANQVKTLVPAVVKIFIYPPSYGVLKERLVQRRQDSPKAIQRRLQWAQREFGVAGEFDYAIINDRLEEAADALTGICLAEHHRSERMKPRLDLIREGFKRNLEEEFSA
ncbi:MAG: guanylate kinase [Thermoanaerobaculales bacterium]|nr:guanylate kinase [Thermoanaerobaculales bacterium]